MHSYTSDTTRWCWAGAHPGVQAIDAELCDAPPPPHLARRAVGLDFWEAWTELEVVAKLTDTPVLALFGAVGLGAPLPEGIRVEHRLLGHTHVCLGWRNE